AIVDVEPVLQGIVLSPELVPSAHDVEVQLSIAVGVEEHGIDVFGQAIDGNCRLAAGTKSPVRLLYEQLARLPLRTPDVDVVQPVAVDIADSQRRPFGRQQVG